MTKLLHNSTQLMQEVLPLITDKALITKLNKMILKCKGINSNDEQHDQQTNQMNKQIQELNDKINRLQQEKVDIESERLRMHLKYQGINKRLTEYMNEAEKP